MRRLEALSAVLIIFLGAKWANLIPGEVSWVHLLGFLLTLSYLLNIDQARNPVTHLVSVPMPIKQFSKMMAVKAGRVSGNPIRFHLKSGEMREGLVKKHSLSSASFVIVSNDSGQAIHEYYDADDIDEIRVTPKPGQDVAIQDEQYAEG